MIGCGVGAMMDLAVALVVPPALLSVLRIGQPADSQRYRQYATYGYR